MVKHRITTSYCRKEEKVVEDILELEDTIQTLVALIEKEYGVGLTHVSIIRDNNSDAPVGELEVKTQWVVASKLDR